MSVKVKKTIYLILVILLGILVLGMLVVDGLLLKMALA